MPRDYLKKNIKNKDIKNKKNNLLSDFIDEMEIKG